MRKDFEKRKTQSLDSRGLELQTKVLKCKGLVEFYRTISMNNEKCSQLQNSTKLNTYVSIETKIQLIHFIFTQQQYHVYSNTKKTKI
jgi:hypothetical protein